MNEPALHDKDRPLNDRGKRDAPKMGERLAKHKVTPDLILSSPAKRALKTAKIIAKKLDYKLADIVVDERLYATGADDLLKVVHKLGAKPKSVMLFGHNPELTQLAHRLSNRVTHLPTCAVAEFTFDAKSWSTIGKDKQASERRGLHTKIIAACQDRFRLTSSRFNRCVQQANDIDHPKGPQSHSPSTCTVRACGAQTRNVAPSAISVAPIGVALSM